MNWIFNPQFLESNCGTTLETVTQYKTYSTKGKTYSTKGKTYSTKGKTYSTKVTFKHLTTQNKPVALLCALLLLLFPSLEQH